MLNYARRCLDKHGLFGQEEFAKRYPDHVTEYWALQRTKPPKKRRGKRGAPTLIEQILDYLRGRWQVQPSEKIAETMVEYNKMKRQTVLVMEFHGEDFKFSPNTSFTKFREITRALRDNIELGRQLYCQYQKYNRAGR